MNWKGYFNWHLFFAIGFLAVFAFAYNLARGPLIPPLAGLRNGGTAPPTPAATSEVEAKAVHIATPRPVKAIYMTSWVAGTPKWRAELVEFIKKSEINSLIVDVKDYTGRIAFDTDDDLIDTLGSEEIRVRDMKEFVETLHDAGIYAIARITVFQDPYYSKKRPEISVQKKSKPGVLWKDRKGLSYVDPAAREFWDYTVRVARAAEKIGFDELNFDYIRFPSDGNMSDILFPALQVTLRERQFIDAPGAGWKVKILSEFFAYLNSKLSDLDVPISADVFGMTTTNYDDLNIGQVLEAIEPHFDYIAPMVYPSHYPTGFQGYKNPASKPYEIVLYSMSKAAERLAAPTSTPAKLRPWLQDFDLGATYDAAKVKAQIKAVYDSGLDSWMIWDPTNKYTRGAYEIE